MSNRTRLPLGDYYQLLLRHGLLADAAPLTADLTHPVSLEATLADAVPGVPGVL